MEEVAEYNIEDFAQFVPQIWKFHLVFNDMEMIFVANDKNWVDARYN